MNKLILENQIGVTILGSGSRGNSALIESSRCRLLVDAGLSASQLVVRLEKAGSHRDAIDGVLLTHEHKDHIRGVPQFLRKSPARLICSRMTHECLRRESEDGFDPLIFEPERPFMFGDFQIEPFAVPHDAYDPVGFRLEHAGKNIVFLTDLGYCTEKVRLMAAQAHCLVIETNYEESLLMADTKRPWATKQRIMARHGHLSNVQAADLISGCVRAPLRHVILVHMSEDCNCPQKAISAIENGLQRAGLKEVAIHPTSQKETSAQIIF